MRLTPSGALRSRVTLDAPSVPQPDGEGGALVLWPPAGGTVLGSRVAALVTTVNRDSQERAIAKTTEGVATYTVIVRYLPGVSLQTRVTVHDGATDRPLYVTGIEDPEQRHRELRLACAEAVA